MKMMQPKTDISQSGTMLGHSFGIGDPRKIITILRKQLYSNPLRVIPQELASNARDAHREIGKDDVPIVITLPNINDQVPQWSVRDFGPGITPGRIANVFVLFGASTKSDSNDQTGGFGIGAKCPFAYTDTFTVCTIVTENGENVKRTYIAYIDKSQMGRLDLAHQEPTNEPCGTEVFIPVKNRDISQFARWTAHACKYWETKPTLKYRDGSDASGIIKKFHPEAEILFAGDGWELVRSWDGSEAIIDGIPYELSPSALQDYLEPNKYPLHQFVARLLRYTIRLYLKTGDVSITASREAIDYNEVVSKKLVSLLSQVAKSIQHQFNQKIKDSKTSFEAMLRAAHARIEFSDLVDTAEWKGKAIATSPIPVWGDGAHIHTFIRKPDLFAISRRKDKYVHLNHGLENDKIVKAVLVDNTGNKLPSVQRVMTFFKQNSDINHVQVITFKDDSDKWTDDENESAKTLKARLNQDHDFKNWGCEDLADYEKTQAPRAKSGKKKRVIKARSMSASGRSVFQPAEVEKEEGEGIYVFYYNRRFYLDSKLTHAIEETPLQRFCKEMKIDIIYAFTVKESAGLGDDWESLKHFVTRKFNKLVSKYPEWLSVVPIHPSHIRHGVGRMVRCVTDANTARCFGIRYFGINYSGEMDDYFSDKIQNSNSLFLTVFRYFQGFTCKVNENDDILQFLGSVWAFLALDLSDPFRAESEYCKKLKDLEVLIEQMNKQYPLLDQIVYRGSGANPHEYWKNVVAEYINAMDFYRNS